MNWERCSCEFCVPLTCVLNNRLVQEWCTTQSAKRHGGRDKEEGVSALAAPQLGSTPVGARDRSEDDSDAARSLRFGNNEDLSPSRHTLSCTRLTTPWVRSPQIAFLIFDVFLRQ